MLTNVFRLGGLRQISWFQLSAADGDASTTETENRPLQHAHKVLDAHIKLQNDGNLSAWTINESSGSSAGGPHLKLWVFIPGRNETINTTVQPSISGLKVIDSGVGSVTKLCNEVVCALGQALRNRMERGLRSVGYLRFGEVFVKSKSFPANEAQPRPLPTCEVIFTISEEAIFVHFLLQRKRVRSLCSDDIQAAVKLQHNGLGDRTCTQPVVVTPHGLNGRLTGCHSSELVHMIYESKSKSVSGQMEQHIDKASSTRQGISSEYGVHAEVNFDHHNYHNNLCPEQRSISAEREDKKSQKNEFQVPTTLFYPTESVLVPLMPTIPSRIFLKRCWLQKLSGTTWIEDELFGGQKLFKNWSKTDVGKLDGLHASNDASRGVKSLSSKSCSSNTSTSEGSSVDNSSSRGSSTSDTDGDAGEVPGELDADAESLILKGKQTQAMTSRQTLDDEMKGFEGVPGATKWGQSRVAGQGEVPVLKGPKRTSSSGGEVSNEISRSLQNRPDAGVTGMVLSPNVGLGTPKAASSQAGTPWDWPEDDRALNMGIENDADILAEFGDFGDFFSDDGLGFGEPPGTAESQALMFPLTDCMDGINSPGNGCLDFSDPMLLPILDIPALDGLEQQQPVSAKDGKVPPAIQEAQEIAKTPEAPIENHNPAFDALPKSEAVLLLAPGFEPVLLPSKRDSQQHSVFKCLYVPATKSANLDSTGGSDIYVYSATPPPSPKMQNTEKKRELYQIVSDCAAFNGKRLKSVNNVGNYCNQSPSSSAFPGITGKSPSEKPTLTGRNLPSDLGTFKYQFNLRHNPSAVLATARDCYLVQLAFIQIKDCKRLELVKSVGSLSNSQEKKKKDRIPSRIAGDVDEEVHDGPRVSNVGVWRPVGTPKPQLSKPSLSSWSDNNQPSSGIMSMDHGTLAAPEMASSNSKQNHRQELLEILPLLIQQGSVPFDVAYDGDSGCGAYGWLTSQEQERRKRVCGPGLVHAVCGGMLSASHFIDNAGVELLDPLACEISAASMASIMQSDMRVAMATSFVDTPLDGPLSIGEWLKGRAFVNEPFGSDSTQSDSKETASTVITGIGEPITPPQCTTGPSSMKSSVQDMDSQPCDGHRSASSWGMEGSSLTDDGCTRRSGQESGSLETDAQLSSSRSGPTLLALPMPSLLVGYQDDWLKVSSSTLHFWEKAPLEPYATPKPVTYYVVCPRIDSLLSATADYLQQLSCVYEACRLGSHMPGNMIFAQNNFPSVQGKHSLSGFALLEFPSQTSPQTPQLNSLHSLTHYTTTLSKTWDPDLFHKSLSKTCKSLPVSSGSTTQREPENSPSLVFYIVCPSSDPEIVLQTMLVACQSIGHNIAISEKQRRLNTPNQMQRTASGSVFAEDPSQGIVGYSTPKIALQILTAETIFKSTTPVSVDIDSLKEVAFGVYNKIRRIPRLCSTDIHAQNALLGRSRPLPMQSTPSMSGMWKDCASGRSSTSSTTLSGHDSLLDSSSFRSNNWDNPWPQQGVLNESSSLDSGCALQDSIRYLFEPLFILAEPGSLDNAVGMSLSRMPGFDDTSGGVHPGPSEALHGVVADSGSDYESKVANLHCCYGWTEDWQWLLSVWTDARGELLDVHLFPVPAGVRSDVKELHNLFIQVLLHGCQLLSMGGSTGSAKLRSLVIARIGAFFDLECQEWQKALFTIGGSEIRKWPIQIWPQTGESNIVSGSSQEISSLGDRTMTLGGMPSSPGPASSVFMSRNKVSSFMKPEIGTCANRKPTVGQNDSTRGVFHLVQSVSFVNIMVDHSLQMIGLNELGPQSSALTSGSQSLLSSNWLNSSGANILTALGSRIGHVKTLGSSPVSYMLIPSHGIHFMSGLPLQLPANVSLESPTIEQILEKSGLAVVTTSAFVVSRAIPSTKTEIAHIKSTEEWPSTLYVGLVSHMSSCLGFGGVKAAKPVNTEGAYDTNSEAHLVLEVIAAEIQALSWLTTSPTCPFRRTPLPFHCEVLQRLRRLLQYAEAQVRNS